ncbi:MAG: toxin ParE1/3/4 [Phenylobacterium sp.]|jgi:toxin ParE1/3/4
MAGFRLTPEAKQDVIGIRRYTRTKWGEQQSKKYMSELRHIFQLLGETPAIGIPCPDIDQDSFRFPHASHVIYYNTSEQQLVVFAVLYKAMMPELHLTGRPRV